MAPPAAGDDVGTETVRHAYGRMLLAARARGYARSATETTRELEGRLSRGPAASAAGALAGSTAVDDAVRYGELKTDGPAREEAVARADDVSFVLGQQPVAKPPGSPTAGA
jgi:hypothetical protein